MLFVTLYDFVTLITVNKHTYISCLPPTHQHKIGLASVLIFFDSTMYTHELYQQCYLDVKGLTIQAVTGSDVLIENGPDRNISVIDFGTCSY